ncbi:hypothetical protein TPA2_gp39 [Tsukamurella phage TPA2]|uniref:hypothetical protein n=1 Tax=Tsukamurella phage TPA2 TaxID=981330 RepID=UPI0001FF8DBE|nr:hypothetical protein TPA2_gp39 [Tsukamurella phage TPA2]ADX31953.1 hypothetical protein [Tsukamurella phage TPA2]
MAVVCIDENLDIGGGGALKLRPWSVPRLVVDEIALSGGDGPVYALTSLPGRLLIDKAVTWTNDSPLPQVVLVRITRGSREWLTSNPNALQLRDRWSYAYDKAPERPVTTGQYNSQVGSAIDTGTNTVSEPNYGRHWCSMDAHSSDEWLRPVLPGETVNLWYQAWLWTPPPWSDNANKTNPQHNFKAGYTRIQLIAFPQQGTVVAG